MLAPFELLIPKTLPEACAMLAEHAGECRVLAGGTDVLVELHASFESPKYLIDIKRLPELRRLEGLPGGGFFIGALTEHHELDRSAELRAHYTALSQGAGSVGSVQIRHRGTIGGNICTAAPSGDTLSPLLALGAQAVVFGPGGEREIPMCEFFTGPKRTALLPGELLTGVILPAYEGGSGSDYIKFSRRNAMDLALLGAAAWVKMREGVCVDARIALTTSAPTPMRASRAERAVIGAALDEKALKRAGETASAEARPRTSWRCTEEYRREVLCAIVPRVLAAARERAEGRA